MRTISLAISVLTMLFAAGGGLCAEVPVSDATQECLDCHATLHPGIVQDWKRSRHAATTPKQAMGAQEIARKVSAKTIPEGLQSVAVGCAECHTLRPEAHAETVEHNGYRMHLVVSPKDCAACHPVEAEQYGKNIMASAHGNFVNNPVYQDLQRTILGKAEFTDSGVQMKPADPKTRAQACLYCHGTRLRVEGIEKRETDMGDMEFARISGWPNQGAGRVNLDGSLGACSACHTRHTFSIEMARKPHTCVECHVGPDVPAFKVYAASKHGNIYSALSASWNFRAVPWTVGKDFTAPTCATCHISLVVDTEGTVIGRRSHQMSDRLPWRIFGLIYAHPQPLDPDTTRIRNGDGLSLPTDLNGAPAASFLIGREEQEKRTRTMQAVCRSCHTANWVKGHWEAFVHAVEETNASTRTATRIMEAIWSRGLAKGLKQGGSLFDEGVEKDWSNIWLFHANTARFAAAMAGGGDFGVFADGRYQLSKEIMKLSEWLKLHKKVSEH